MDVPKAGSYALTFYAANRSTPGLNGPQTLEVLLDNAVIAGGTFTGLPYSWTKETIDLALNSGPNLITFETTHTGDQTDFVNDVSLVAVRSSNVPEPSSYLLFISGLGAILWTRFAKKVPTLRSAGTGGRFQV